MADIDNELAKKCPKVVDEALGKDYTGCEAREAVVKPADIVPAITSDQYQSLKNNTGIYNNGRDNCTDFNGELLCDIRQDLEFVLQNRPMTIFANDFSKCSDDDKSPTLASMWSRIYRFSQAVSAVLCAYDPFIATLLKQGKYPEVLMGAVQAGGYPQWIKPDEVPKENSKAPVTSGGIVTAIHDALMAVWHVWEEHPEFDYYAGEYNTGNNPLTSQTGMVEGDTALVGKNGSKWNVIYKYTGGHWVEQSVLGLGNVPNFSVTHINKGYWADKELYMFHDTETNTDTWNIMDADLSNFTRRIEAVEAKYNKAVMTGDSVNYLLTTRANFSSANSVACANGKDTIVLITG